MSELPAGWVVCRLSDIGHIVTGKTPSTKEPRFYGGEIPFIKPGDLDHSGPVISTEVYLTDDGLAEVPALPSDSIVVTCIGNLGKVGITTKPSASNQQINAIVPDQSVDPTYIFDYCKTLKPWLESESSATTISIVNKGIFSTAPVPLPPLAEQARIAAKLDELLAQVDTLKARIDAIPNLLKRFRQSVLAAAVSGRLTEEWREANSNSGSQYDDSNLPAGWSVIPLGRYAINYDGARRPISAKERESLKGEHPYFGATGQIDSIDGFTHDGEFVLVGEDGANLLTRAKPIAFIAQGKIWVNNHAHVIASPTGHSNAYLTFYLNTLDITPWVSGSAQPKLNQKNMNEIPVHVPPPSEQTKIVRRVEQLFAFADQLEAKVASAKSRIDHLTQSILAKAFRGELVPQDPNDEPASVLLERIKTQRAAAPKAKRGKARKESSSHA